MTVSAGKVTGGLLLLVGVWIAVYWWWEPSEPKVSFSKAPAAAHGAPAARYEPPPPNSGPAPAMATVQQSVAPAPAPAPKSGAPSPSAETPAQTAAKPSPTPPPTPAVKPPEFWTHRVTGGETLETISTHFYKTPNFASAIARANPLMDPTKLRAGREIRVPKDPTNIQGIPQTDIKPSPEAVVKKPIAGAPPGAPAPKPAPAGAKAEAKQEPAGTTAPAARRTHKVEDGDTLSGISQKYYGTQGKTRLIYEANKDKLKSEDDLRIGIELVIPDLPDKKSSN